MQACKLTGFDILTASWFKGGKLHLQVNSPTASGCLQFVYCPGYHKGHPPVSKALEIEYETSLIFTVYRLISALGPLCYF